MLRSWRPPKHIVWLLSSRSAVQQQKIAITWHLIILRLRLIIKPFEVCLTITKCPTKMRNQSSEMGSNMHHNSGECKWLVEAGGRQICETIRKQIEGNGQCSMIWNVPASGSCDEWKKNDQKQITKLITESCARCSVQAAIQLALPKSLLLMFYRCRSSTMPIYGFSIMVSFCPVSLHWYR